MEKDKIRQISEFLKDLEGKLYECDFNDIIARQKLNEVYRLIPRLMDATFEVKDSDLKILLASLEYKARKCKEYIELRTGIRN
jgi:hypothetical protein